MLGLGLSLIHGSTISDSETLIASYDFNSDTGSTATSNTLPSGWEKSGTAAIENFTIYGTTTDTTIGASNRAIAGWIFDDEGTASTGTGCLGAHDAGPDTFASAVDPSNGGSNDTGRYLLYEATNASSSSERFRGVIRTEELDFSGYSTITMTFWFHAFGSAFGGGVGGAVAVTTEAQSSSSADEAGAGLGLTSDTLGGATITYDDLGGTSHSVVRIGSGGQVQTSGHLDAANASTNHWIKATCDLSAAAGQSSVYIHFVMITNQAPSSAFRQDLCIDSISIIGS